MACSTPSSDEVKERVELYLSHLRFRGLFKGELSGTNDGSAEGVAEMGYWMIRVRIGNEKCVKVDSSLVLRRLTDVG